MTAEKKALEIYHEINGYEGVIYHSTAVSISVYCAQECREAAEESLKEWWTEVIAELENI